MNLERPVCNLCGHNAADVLFRQRDSLTREPTEFAVVQCRGCGLVYVNPRPAPAEMSRFYTSDFVSYQFRLLGLSREGASVRRQLVAWLTRQSADARARAVSAVLRANPNGRVLDIGCGAGAFLHQVSAEFGNPVEGIDFDDASVRFCRDELGLKGVICGGVEKLVGLTPGFALVTMWHFLEHEHDPLKALQLAARLLSPKGVLIVEVPNVKSAENCFFGTRSYLYDVPRHLYHFSRQSLSMLLQRAGLNPQLVSYPLFSGGWLGSVQQALLGGRIYRRLEDHVYAFLVLSQLVLPADWATALAGRGSIMRVVASRLPQRERLP